jgi:endonuclease-3 related protein
MIRDPAAIYRLFKKQYGSQGWWPLIDENTGESCYCIISKASDYEIFEISIGAILTQAVSWKNVEKALYNLKKAGLLDPVKLHKTPLNKIAEKIKPSGYFNQKALKIKNFLAWFEKYNFSSDKIVKCKTEDIRKELLSIKGIGPETADSILLYAFNRKVFVVDAYTKRIFSRLGLVNGKSSYNELQKFFHESFPGSVKIYNEYHALIVAHGKDICKSKPLCGECCFRSFCLICR